MLSWRERSDSKEKKILGHGFCGKGCQCARLSLFLFCTQVGKKMSLRIITWGTGVEAWRSVGPVNIVLIHFGRRCSSQSTEMKFAYESEIQGALEFFLFSIRSLQA